jgi:hypothetical protein
MRRGVAFGLLAALVATASFVSAVSAQYQTLCECCGFQVLQVCGCFGTVDAAPNHPSDILLRWIDTHYPIAGTKSCGSSQQDRYWAHTFADIKPPGDCKIVGAYLCITVRNQADNDHIKIAVISDPSEDWSWANGHWQRRLNYVGIPVNAAFTVTFDLSNLYHPDGRIDLLPEINSKGWLDVAVDDDSIVEHMALILILGIPAQER